MLNITLLCVGKLKEAYWRDACAEYAKRLNAFCRFRLIEVAEERLPDNPSASQIAATIEAEGKRILEQIPRDSAVIPLCIEGRELDSPALAARRNWRWMAPATLLLSSAALGGYPMQ